MQVLQKEIHKRTTANQSSSSFDSSSTPIMMSVLTSSSEKKTTEIRKKNLLSLWFDDLRSPTFTVDEFASWMSSTLTLDDEENDDILGFWSYHNQSFPIISTINRMALILFLFKVSNIDNSKWEVIGEDDDESVSNMPTTQFISDDNMTFLSAKVIFQGIYS
ncbi:unnamed protein product [Rotaria sordida]|uniref:Uncharacterized protein n=1 Tax=Rotaria sordida TaxID=392033 RepID=A0A815QLK3_9BILA|nr:unnamed protein product [Rotaria sordida]